MLGMNAVLLFGRRRRRHHGDPGRLKGRRLLLMLLLDGGDRDHFLLREGLLLESGLALALDVRLGVGDDPLFALEVVALVEAELGDPR